MRISLSTRVSTILFVVRYKNHYLTLGLDNLASQKQIKQKYYSLAKKLHPDVAGNSQEIKKQFQKVKTAYQVLSNIQSRVQYDRSLVANNRGNTFGSGSSSNDFSTNTTFYASSNTRQYTTNASWNYSEYTSSAYENNKPNTDHHYNANKQGSSESQAGWKEYEEESRKRRQEFNDNYQRMNRVFQERERRRRHVSITIIILIFAITIYIGFFKTKKTRRLGLFTNPVDFTSQYYSTNSVIQKKYAKEIREKKFYAQEVVLKLGWEEQDKSQINFKPVNKQSKKKKQSKEEYKIRKIPIEEEQPFKQDQTRDELGQILDQVAATIKKQTLIPDIKWKSENPHKYNN